MKKKLLSLIIALSMSAFLGVSLARADTFSLEAVAYSPEDCGASVGESPHTACGTDLRPGVIAVDPDFLPMGSLLEVSGYGLAQAEDTGGAIVGPIVDLAMNNTDEALAWGRRTVTATLLRRGWEDWQTGTLSAVLERVVVGFKDGKDPALNRPSTRAELAVMLARLLKIAPAASIASFRDVPPTHWAAPTLAALRQKEILRGEADGCFRPDDPVTWQALQAVLGRLGVKDPHPIYLHPDSLTRGEILVQLKDLPAPTSLTP